MLNPGFSKKSTLIRYRKKRNDNTAIDTLDGSVTNQSYNAEEMF